MKRELICIGCPMGCQLTAEVENGAVTSVTGNTCPRGDAYARRECVAPVRTVTGTVAIEGAALPVLPVRTSGEIRLSNYLLWQLAYSEIYITDCLWPDFNRDELIKAIEQFNQRDRRFGGVKA